MQIFFSRIKPEVFKEKSNLPGLYITSTRKTSYYESNYNLG